MDTVRYDLYAERSETFSTTFWLVLEGQKPEDLRGWAGELTILRSLLPPAQVLYQRPVETGGAEGWIYFEIPPEVLASFSPPTGGALLRRQGRPYFTVGSWRLNLTASDGKQVRAFDGLFNLSAEV
jgi:hypothetical protein